MEAACSSSNYCLDEIVSKCAEATAKLIPTKSIGRYEKEYRLFCDWRKDHKAEKNVNEDIMLAYFLDASKKYNSSTLWAKYSMVKSTLLVNENVNISKYCKLTAFLKRESVGHHPNQSKVLSREEVNRFMKEAPTKDFLLIKVIAMLGIAGGCRRDELYNLSIDDVVDSGSQLVVTINQTKTYVKRVFTVLNECDGINFLELYRNYRHLRPKTMTH